MRKVVYLIGSLRNPIVPQVAAKIRQAGIEVFDDWYAAGPIADDSWMEYERARGKTFEQALNDYAARHVLEFDRHHLNRAHIGVLVMPAGKSGHLELGYLAGQGKPTFVYFPEEPERWDVMYGLTHGIRFDLDRLCMELVNVAFGTGMD